MPLVRISLIKGKSSDYVRAIADCVQQALVETYNVPPDDRFQMIEQLDRDALIYDLTTSACTALTISSSSISSPDTGATRG